MRAFVGALDFGAAPETIGSGTILDDGDAGVIRSNYYISSVIADGNGINVIVGQKIRLFGGLVILAVAGVAVD